MRVLFHLIMSFPGALFVLGQVMSDLLIDLELHYISKYDIFIGKIG